MVDPGARFWISPSRAPGRRRLEASMEAMYARCSVVFRLANRFARQPEEPHEGADLQALCNAIEVVLRGFLAEEPQWSRYDTVETSPVCISRTKRSHCSSEASGTAGRSPSARSVASAGAAADRRHTCPPPASSRASPPRLPCRPAVLAPC